jgi:hypothetical protein
MKYVIIAPHQGGKARRIGDEAWTEVANSSVNARRPYLCNLKSGRPIAVFVYDGYMAKSFEDTLLYNYNRIISLNEARWKP